MERIASGTNFACYRLGSVVVTALRDGHVDMPPSRLRQPGDRPFGDDLPFQVPLHDGKMRLSVNAFLVETGTGLALVDMGASDAWLPSMGLLPRALEEAGVAADRITAVALTHTHEDHVNGLVLPGGADAFLNLEGLWVPEAELSLFRAEPGLARFRARARPFVAGQMLGGVLEVVAATGHEVGHSCFRVVDGANELLIRGDTVHVPAIQFERPELAWEFDADQKAARVSRLRLLDRAARDRYWVAGSHLDWPGVGKVMPGVAGYGYLPV